jgi:hypothetical protein
MAAQVPAIKPLFHLAGRRKHKGQNSSIQLHGDKKYNIQTNIMICYQKRSEEWALATSPK